MTGRGTRLFFLSMTLVFCLAALSTGYALPVVQASSYDSPRSIALYRLCQDRPEGEPDFSSYFTAPERESQTTYVFYNKFIDPENDKEFGYALLYGLELAAGKAEADDYLAVGIYFSNQKGEIYGIAKKAFDEFRRKKLEAKDLLKYLSVRHVDLTGKSPAGSGNQ